MANYYTLVPALPALAPLNKLQELPCSTLKLEQRLTMLDEHDRAQLECALRLCQRERLGDEALSDADEVQRWRDELAQIEDADLRALISDYLESRTLVAALRYRLAGQQNGHEFEGFSERLWLIQRNWQLPLFGLEGHFPWLARAREALEAGQARALEQMLLERFWERLRRFERAQMFSFAAVAAYRLRWALAEYRLRWDATAAQDSFDQWVTGVLARFGTGAEAPLWTGSEA
jgi:hypothetical protein